MPTPTPLTTLFTPIFDCLTEFYITVGDTGAYTGLGPFPLAYECFPPGWMAAPTYYFSPGLCPAGYTTVALHSSSIGTALETQATCCPRQALEPRVHIQSLLTRFSKTAISFSRHLTPMTIKIPCLVSQVAKPV